MSAQSSRFSTWLRGRKPAPGGAGSSTTTDGRPTADGALRARTYCEPGEYFNDEDESRTTVPRIRAGEQVADIIELALDAFPSPLSQRTETNDLPVPRIVAKAILVRGNSRQALAWSAARLGASRPKGNGKGSDHGMECLRTGLPEGALD